MVKLQSHFQTDYAIYPNLGEKLPPKEKPTSKDLSNNDLRHLAFVELKKANGQIALVQHLKVSFSQIQKELGELQKLNVEALNGDLKKDLSKENFFQRIKHLQSKLDPLLKQAKLISISYSSSDLSSNNLKNLQRGVVQIQDNLSLRFEEITKEIEDFFKDKKEVSFQKEKLQDSKFALAHQSELLSSSIQTLL